MLPISFRGRSCWGLAAVWMGVLAAAAAAEEPKISFTRQIKPILASKCFACHGPDEKERKAELRLDVRDEAVPAVIKPGDAEHSELVVRITTRRRRRCGCRRRTRRSRRSRRRK